MQPPLGPERPLTRPYEPVDLQADGVLWMVNKTVFHPRGFALALAEDGSLSLMGDGSEPWTFEHSIEFEPFDAFLALLARTATKGSSLDASDGST